MKTVVTREEFDKAVDAVWSEIEYQNSLERRTPDEATTIPGFFTLISRYLDLLRNDWADNPGTYFAKEKKWVVPQCCDGLRKIAAIAIRGMIYNIIQKRG